MNFFEKQEFKNKDKVSYIKEQFNKKQIYFNEMPKDVLVELLEIAIDKIDEKENGGEFDERDFKDCICDKYFIVNDLFLVLEENIEMGIYK